MKKAISSVIGALPVLVLITLFTISSIYASAPVAVAMDREGVEESATVTETVSIESQVPAFFETIPEENPLEEFMSKVDNERSKEMYTKLFNIYEFEPFVGRTEIPQYFQSLYLTPFASGTIKSSGCGITCLSMITTYLFEETITPDMLTRGYRGDNPAWVMEKQIEEMNLRCDMYYGNKAVTELDKAMENGNPVILMHRDTGERNIDSIFTDGGHFIVLAGMTEDGRYLVNDPNMYNLLSGKYTDEYMNGFTRSQILKGLVGTYVFDTKAEFNGDPTLIPNRQVTE